MVWDEMVDKWDDLKDKVKEEWGDLTDEDIDEVGGDRDTLVEKLQGRYGWDRSEAERRADEWETRNRTSPY